MTADSLLIVKKMLDFLYTGDYDEDVAAEFEEISALTTSPTILLSSFMVERLHWEDKYDILFLRAYPQVPFKAP